MRYMALLMLTMLAAGPAWAANAKPQTPKIEMPWARATAGRAETGAAYLRLVGAERDDRLLAASSPVAETVELHTHLDEDGVMRMRPVPAIAVPAAGMVELKPGGLHIMLIGLKGPLKEGRRFPLTLIFERAGPVETEVPVLAAGARSGG